ncbi:MAG: phosphoenolpyruvate--protein phosphotransferase [Deltaproteobacteria bacterium]|nr:phosphoenolpyruvate--protein phosphotransferase [Deltaproteobacteria bacterium]MCB9788329.1 phosphoenolpyruvate--protein phosphotransferase [Deltaproteobacteria bacterium]
MTGMTQLNRNLGMVLRGVGVSPGIVLGVAARMDREDVQIERVHLPTGLLEAEVSRLGDAVNRAALQLDELQRSLVESDLAEGEHLGVLNAHKVMLRDPMLLGEAEQRIRTQCLNAEWAIHETVQHIQEIFARMEDPFFRERVSDIQHVAGMLMRALLGEDDGADLGMSVRPGEVVVASSLSPAETLSLARLPVAGFALEDGTATSHTAIIAHSLGIPAVVGVGRLTEHVGNGENIILDGAEGEVIVHPSQDEELVYGRRARRARAFLKALRQNRELPAVTPDGYGLVLRGNLDIAEGCARIADAGGTGIGLFRTEFLFLDRTTLPSEDEQYATYSQVLAATAPEPVTIRTLDIGGDKLLRVERPEAAAALGLRAIRYCLKDRALFDTQLRALLRASAHGNLRVLIPFVTSLGEVKAVRKILGELRAQLQSEGRPMAPEIPLGAMIETPAAALISDLLAGAVDFFSVGTNDLIQYTLAISRDETAGEYLYNPLHPAMLRTLQMVARAGRSAGIDISMCGEMAGDPRYVLVLLALGFHELSMTASSIPAVKEVVRRTPRSDALVLLQKIMNMSSAEEIADYVDSYMVEHFSDLVTPRMREAPRYAR